MKNDTHFGWSFLLSLAPRVLIFAVCIFAANVAGSLWQMCYSPFTIPGTCTNPEYMPLHYSMSAMGGLFGVWGMFIYNIWTTDSSDEGDVID